MFQIRGEQIAALRRKKIGDALIELIAPIFGGAFWDPAGQSILLEDSLGSRGRLGFDVLGYLSTYTSPLDRTWQLTNTQEGKPLRLVTPSGYVVAMEYTAEGFVGSFATSTQTPTSLFYDRRRWIGSGFADGTWDRIDYTDWNAVARLTNRLGTQVECEYDGHRRLTAIRDGNGNKTQFLYSNWSRPDAVIYPNGSGEAFAYGDAGRLCSIVQDDISLKVEVNDAGRPTKLTYSDGLQLKYDYDESGVIANADDGQCRNAFVYNDSGQLAQETTDGDVHLLTYDASHRLIQTEVLGRKTIFQWDADQRLIGYIDWNGTEHKIEYLPQERGHVVTGPSGLRSFTELGVDSRLAKLNITSSGSSLFALTCSYNPGGHLSTSEDSFFGSRAFTYDPDGKLLYADASTSDRREMLSYDRAGNPLVINGQRLTFDPANQLLQAGDEIFSWDGRGNLIERSGPLGRWAYRYNACNHLIASRSPDGLETIYTYDAIGRRLLKRTGSRETRFIWVGEQLAAELNIDVESGSVTQQDFLYHPETGAPLATCVDGEVYTFATDHLGTPRALFSKSGEIVWLAELSAFGIAKVLVDKIPNALRFRGQYFDSETGLHYNRFRYYAPEWGRYITRDPLTFLAGTNHYQYADGNPVNITDPYGLFGWKNVAVIAASVAVAAVVVIAAPVAAPIALLLAGAAAGAVAGGLNEALNERALSLPCIARAAGLGALAGVAAALPFLALPATAGVAAFAGAGAMGGALSYGVNLVDGAEKNPSMVGLGTSMLIGGVSAGVAKGITEASAPGRIATPARLPAQNLTKEGWPDLPSEQAPNFVSAKPVNLPQGTKLYRIIDDPAGAGGGYWARELPASKADWRSDYAVQPDWNDNGHYVEETIQDPNGLNVWEGPVASQGDLSGGKSQVWMPPGTLNPTNIKPTGW